MVLILGTPTAQIAITKVVCEEGAGPLPPVRSVILPFFFTKEFVCITRTVEHNYISPSSTVGIQLHVSIPYVGHLQFVI